MASGCDSADATPLKSIEDIRDVVWTDKDGEKVTISGGPTNIYWQGKHSWIGTFQDGKLHLTRFPKPDEMGNAPDWARQAAAMPAPTGGPSVPLGGQAAGSSSPQYVQWELELEAKTECGQPVLVGKWYPGSFDWSEDLDPQGAEIVASRKITKIGKGDPVDIKYFREPPAIVGVAVLEKQTRNDELGLPFFLYPFQPGADDTGAALTTRTLFVYGVALPKGSGFQITSDDPNISYYLYAPQRFYEINRGYLEPFERGLKAAQAAQNPAYASTIANMDSFLLRARLSRGVLPGIKSFKINGIAGSWELRFSDDVALISFARAGDGSTVPPSELKPEQVQLTQYLFKPERFFIEVRTKAPLPLQAIPLEVGVDGRRVSWSGSKMVSATLIPGSTTVYRTPAIDLALPGGSAAEPGVFSLPTDGAQIVARPQNPWLLRHNPAAAKLLSGPGDLGHTFKYYLRRVAIADNVQPLPDLSVPDGWRQLSGRTATKLYDVALLSGYFGGSRKPKTWKKWLIDWYLRVNNPLCYFIYHVDDVILTVNVSVAEHAALLFFRDTFIDQMNTAIAQWQMLYDDYNKDKNSALMRGLRDFLKINAWSADQVWRYVQVTCPGGSQGISPVGLLQTGDLLGTCSVAYALSDAYLKK